MINDFSPYQMECDAALEKLGLLWKCYSAECCPAGKDQEPSYNYGIAPSCYTCGASNPKC